MMSQRIKGQEFSELFQLLTDLVTDSREADRYGS
jgi:hypothetical protein